MARPLASLPLRLSPEIVTISDAEGRFHVELPTPLREPRIHIQVVYDAAIELPSGERPHVQVVDDLLRPRHVDLDRSGRFRGDGALDLGTIELDGLDCETFRLGHLILRDYLAVRGAPPPQGGIRFKRWTGVYGGAPYAFYNYISVPTNFFDTQWGGVESTRKNTFFHEFGHTVRHAADGDETHWNWDNFRWAYARNHSGTEITNVQYAFNEGWAQYWQKARNGGHASYCAGRPEGWQCPSPDNRDWNEGRVADRLLELSQLPGVNDRLMLEILEAHPGDIHSLHDFENFLADRIGHAPFADPASCPPDYTDDGATCRRQEIVTKPSYGRGAGSAPEGCGEGRERDAGLCYPTCAPGYVGVGPVCWHSCAPGYSDDGAVCRRNGQIISADNSQCPGYDKCGLTFARGCSSCPPGYSNDGCTCRVDPHIYAKDTYVRGAGSVPSGCSQDEEDSGGLCYPKCQSGYSGVGPVCWGICPDGFQDHGATCFRPSSIIVKY